MKPNPISRNPMLVPNGLSQTMLSIIGSVAPCHVPPIKKLARNGIRASDMIAATTAQETAIHLSVGISPKGRLRNVSSVRTLPAANKAAK